MMKSDSTGQCEEQNSSKMGYSKARGNKKNTPSIDASQFESVSQESKTVLLVDDEASILNLASRILRKRGYQVLETSNPMEALNIAKSHVGNIQLIVSDIMMPEMNGRDLVRELKTIRPDIKVLFISGFDGENIFEKIKSDMEEPFLPKPFTVKDFTNKVREVMNA